MIIYRWTNKLNGKVYIGQTIFTLESRTARHKADVFTQQRRNKFYNAVRKYGMDGFDIEVIDTANTQEELDEKERYWIAFHDAVSAGYNMRTGGKNGNMLGAEAKAQIASTLREHYSDPENRERQAAGATGRKQSAETLAKKAVYSKARAATPEGRESLRQASLTRHAKPGEKEKVAQQFREQWADPGYRQRMSEERKNRWADPEFHKRMSQVRKEQWTEESRALRSRLSREHMAAVKTDPKHIEGRLRANQKTSEKAQAVRQRRLDSGEITLEEFQRLESLAAKRREANARKRAEQK